MSLAWLAAALFAACVIFDIYTRIPPRFGVTPLGLDPSTHAAVLLFHGCRSEKNPTLLALEQKLRLLARAQPRAAAVGYVWAPHSRSPFRCQANGEHIGTAIGIELAALPELESLHLIGQSAGAYLLDPLCDAYRRAGGRARVAMTYLDPQGFRGGFDPWWGARHYGARADYAEAFVNTDDRALGTNSFLRHAWNVDVTGVTKPPGYKDGGHRWPMHYYLGQVNPGDITAAAYSHRERPRGAVFIP